MPPTYALPNFCSGSGILAQYSQAVQVQPTEYLDTLHTYPVLNSTVYTVLYTVYCTLQ